MRPSNSELQFSSSVAKLLQHPDRLQHPLYPITLQIALTDVCNLNCSFCSVKYRRGNTLAYEKIQRTLDNPIFSSLLSVELTGGGEPTLYPQINELIYDLWNRELKIGLITNGVALMEKLTIAALRRLRWLRVSLNGLDYLPDVNLDGLPPCLMLGFSYVINEHTTQETIDKVGQYAEKYHARYVRIVPDCLDLDREWDFDVSHPSFYVQTKTSGPLKPVAPCRMGYLKPYLNSDGFFYWCSGVCLEKRYFPEEYRMGEYPAEIWDMPQMPFECHFSKCFWVEHNYLLELINTPIAHREFV